MATGRPFDSHVEELIALTGDYRVARAAYEEAVKRRPGRIVTLRQKTRLLADSREEAKCIYISEHGNDKNDGRSRETPVYSWKRAVNLCDGNSEMRVMERPTLQRLTGEIEKRRKMKDDRRQPLNHRSNAGTILDDALLCSLNVWPPRQFNPSRRL
jgi:hypothetical protein